MQGKNNQHNKLKQLMEKAMNFAAENLIVNKIKLKQSILVADGNSVKEIPFNKLKSK